MITTVVSIKIGILDSRTRLYTNNLALVLGLNIVVGFGRENNGTP